MTEMGLENVFYLENFECVDAEVLVESSSPPPAPPAPPDMAARLAHPAQQGGGAGASPDGGGGARDIIVIPAAPGTMHLQHTIHQVSEGVVEVRTGDSSGQSSPTATEHHHYITVHGESGVGYHVQYVEPQEMYSQPHHTHMETLRAYPVYAGGAGASGGAAAEGGGEAAAWGGAGGADTFAYGAVVAADEARSAPDPPRAAASPAPPAHRTPPATLTWLLDNYETAEGVSLPRSTLYAHYLRHCAAHDLEPVNAASFGKLIRSVFLGLRTRRLGTRGNSKYHYYGIRAKPSAALAGTGADDEADPADGGDRDPLGSDSDDKASVSRPSQSGEARGSGGGGETSAEHRQHLGAAAPPDLPPLELVPPAPADISAADVALFRRHYHDHCSAFLDAVASLELAGVERARREFWRRASHEDGSAEADGGAALPRRTLYRLAARRDVAAWLRRADLALYQRAVELLLPDVLRPIPSALTQSIRNFAKTLEGALAAATAGAPAASARAGADAASALAAALRRYTSLNHLAQAARAVLHNSHQIHQMLTDLNRVDFRVVREQAAWACACGRAPTAHDLEADFKATLGRGATLEQWAAWLERAVRSALGAHERRADYAARARRFLLHWSFYSSLVIRELTLRSAASFGSFHLIRLLYDEYVAYLVEQRVAHHEGTPPIAVMHHAPEEEEEEDEEEEEEEEEEWEWAEGDGDAEGEGEPAAADVSPAPHQPPEKKIKLE